MLAQRELRDAKGAAARGVVKAHEALVSALESNLDGSPAATAAEKALEKARKAANQPWDAKAEAAGRLATQARQKRGEFITVRIDDLIAEMAEPARTWPARAREALERLAAVAAEYDAIGGPIERLAREAGRDLRLPDNPLDTRQIRRQAASKLHAPIPAPGRMALDPPPEGFEELGVSPSGNAHARFVDDRKAA